tara:strand:- start:277 stop:543 length:267 start_codon:yes stop_codon:yes gene_type:complete
MNIIEQFEDTKIVNPLVKDGIKNIIDFHLKILSDFFETYGKSIDDNPSDYQLESTCETSLLSEKIDTMLREFLNEIDDLKTGILEEVK